MKPDDDKTQTHVILTRGTMVSHYRIVEKIGAGGMGEVYLAEDTKLKRQVALKFLPSHLCEDEDCRARFKREAQAAAKLNHPNIVTIHDVSEHQGRPFFAMEHVEGPSLRQVIRSKELSLEKVIDLALHICEGLSKAHQSGIVHRDVKPSNIVVDKEGRPKLLDFGLAAIKGTEQLTKTGSTLGTVGYMSPEQIQGKDVDHRSDLFSLGVMLYEMITGQIPFKAETEAATLNSVLNDTPEPLSRFKSGVSDDLQRIVTKLLEKDPSLRYQSAAGVISDLKRLTVGAAASATQPRKDWWNRIVIPAAVIVLAVMFAFWYWQFQPDTDSGGVKSLVVLPFENLGAVEDEYFADGMTDEITARLAGLSGLRVISRTSAVHYKGSGKPLKVIARELKVDYVLEGTIRWDKSGDTSRVRIIPQLIRASDDSHIWAGTFERALTQVFAVQADIAEQIANTLNINLLGEEKHALRQTPTDNMEAYDYYLRGRELGQSFRDRRDLEMVATLFEKAVSIDTGFVSAYAELSITHSRQYWWGYDRSSERSHKARSAAERAMVLDSSNALARAALGYYYYYIERDFDKALLELESARKSSPNNADILAAIGYIKRRKGEWEESYDFQERALRLNPLSSGTRSGLVETARIMRRFDDAQMLDEKGIELFPDDLTNYTTLGGTFVDRDGDPLRALQLLDSAPPGGERSKGVELYSRWWYYLLLRQYEDAQKCIVDYVEYCQTAEDTASYLINIAETYHLLGQTLQSRAYYDSARAYIEALDDRELAVGGFWRPSLGLVYARLGAKEKAIEAARRDTARLPLSDDAFLGEKPLVDLAVTYARVGEFDKAIDLIDTLLSIPSSVTVAKLRLDPYYDPLRDHPRFQALLEKYE